MTKRRYNTLSAELLALVMMVSKREADLVRTRDEYETSQKRLRGAEERQRELNRTEPLKPKIRFSSRHSSLDGRIVASGTRIYVTVCERCAGESPLVMSSKEVSPVDEERFALLVCGVCFLEVGKGNVPFDGERWEREAKVVMASRIRGVE